MTKVLPARAILSMCSIPISADFHALHSAQVEALLEWADACRYRKPRNASGSRARCFHQMIQRRAQGITMTDARRRAS